METLIIKYTLGTMFLGSTLLFLVKLGMLLWTVAQTKLAMLAGGGWLDLLRELIAS